MKNLQTFDEFVNESYNKSVINEDYTKTKENVLVIKDFKIGRKVIKKGTRVNIEKMVYNISWSDDPTSDTKLSIYDAETGELIATADEHTGQELGIYRRAEKHKHVWDKPLEDYFDIKRFDL